MQSWKALLYIKHFRKVSLKAEHLKRECSDEASLDIVGRPSQTERTVSAKVLRQNHAGLLASAGFSEVSAYRAWHHIWATVLVQ